MFPVTLVDQARKNDRKAQLTLYNLYADAMFCVAMRFLKHEADAEDASQEAFIKAFQKLGQYRGEVTFGAWLKKIVIHTCLDWLRMRKDHWLPLDETYLHLVDEEDWMVEDNGLTVDEVKKAIERLPDRYQYVTMLYLIDGYSHSEIAEALHITEVASRTQLMRAKAKLKELLKNRKNGTGY